MKWYDVFNKGIPSDKGMGFTIDLVGLNCATDKTKFVKGLTEELVVLNDYLQKYNNIIMLRKGLLALTIDEDLTQYLTFSPQIFILSMLENLDGEYTIEDQMYETRLIEIARRKIRDLRKIKYSQQLEKEFPTLYENYKMLEDKFNEMQRFRKEYAISSKLGSVNAETYKKHMDAYKALMSLYGFSANMVNVKTYIENICKTYSNLLKPENYDKITRIIKSSPISMEKFNDCLDKEKFELLMAVSSLSNAKFNKEDAIANISYLTQYFREHENDIDKDISVEMFFDGEERIISRKDLYKYYKQFLIENPEVKIVRKSREDFEGQTLQDIEAYLKQFEGELEVSWDILPSGETLFERTRSSESTITDEERKQKEENKERILREKEEFFKENKPYLVLKGKESFLGYVGYIYPNAYVVLEKFYKNKKGTSIAEDAIYIMKVEEFIDLSVKSKPEIIENHLCHRVTHHRGWQGKVEDILRKEVTEDTIERVQIFENQIRHLN